MLLCQALCLPDHPRACGANRLSRRSPRNRCGSSPRMRGKRHEHCRRALRRRIIPAHAGQTVRLASPRVRLPDHPRACGANDRTHGAFVHVRGSSPRMRGKPAHVEVGTAGHRIIPAHAGQTIRLEKITRCAMDHPRACGANARACGVRAQGGGSSPRMRGKRAGFQSVAPPARIIPAHAGQTATCPTSTCPTTDHPRACGANRDDTAHDDGPFGSSPRMRGKPS